jgi:hypothetical protein
MSNTILFLLLRHQLSLSGESKVWHKKLIDSLGGQWQGYIYIGKEDPGLVYRIKTTMGSPCLIYINQSIINHNGPMAQMPYAAV